MFWFEEPVPPEDIEGYIEIKAKQDIPVAGGEAEFTRFGFREILARRAIDIIQPDICAAGGFPRMHQDRGYGASLRRALRIPHTWGTAIANAASLHWLAVLPHTASALYPIRRPCSNGIAPTRIRDALMTDALRPVKGVATIPDTPGLGLDIDRDVVRKFEVT